MATDEHDHNGHDPHGDEVVDEQLQSEFDELLNVGIDVAQQLLEEDGGFLPFAVALTKDGETQVLMLEEDDDLDGEAVLAALVEELTENRAGLVGAALVSDVLLDDDQDAIRVDIEHSDPDTEAMVMALQYAPTGEPGEQAAGEGDGEGDADDYEFGELLGSVGERRIWV